MVSADEWIRTTAAAISPVLVVLGWWWVNRQNNCRESRKESRQLVDRALRAVTDSVNLIISYHSGKENDGVARDMVAWKVVLALKQVSDDISLLSRNGFDTSECGKSYILLKQLATGNDFLTEAGLPWDNKDSRWTVLLDTSSCLRHTLDRLFFDRFKY